VINEHAVKELRSSPDPDNRDLSTLAIVAQGTEPVDFRPRSRLQA
jgi:hypothetical protein